MVQFDDLATASANAFLQGRTLEEVDELFAAKLAAWRFKGYETHGTARLLADLETKRSTTAQEEIMAKVQTEKDVH